MSKNDNESVEETLARLLTVARFDAIICIGFREHGMRCKIYGGSFAATNASQGMALEAARMGEEVRTFVTDVLASNEGRPANDGEA